MVQNVQFIKMNGLGNDFVIINMRDYPGLVLDKKTVMRLASRHFGIGCDQLVTLEEPVGLDADIKVTFYNADGSTSGACGNATRCVADIIAMEEGRSKRVVVATANGNLICNVKDNGIVGVNMGKPKFNWNEIPLASRIDGHIAPIEQNGLVNPFVVNMGNPHAVFFVENTEEVDLAKYGPLLEHDSIFPERANINVATIAGENSIRLRVWERGTGETYACGSGACATFVAACSLNLAKRDKSGTIRLNGGNLQIEWLQNGDVYMEGPVADNFMGIVPID